MLAPEFVYFELCGESDDSSFGSWTTDDLDADG
jgi:hypothetical protein